MAKIYSNAYYVIIQLGKKVEDINKALEDIQLAANKELIERLKKKNKLASNS